MPESGKMRKNREHAANRAAGLGKCYRVTVFPNTLSSHVIINYSTGDASGRLPSRVKAETVVINCAQCMMPIRMSKSNADARLHVESKHPTATFASCFPGQFDPTVAVAAAPVIQATTTATIAPKPKPKAKSDDLSFLDAALSSNPVKGKANK